MQWTMDVNSILKEEITLVDSSLLPSGFEGDMRSTRHYNVSHRSMQEAVSRVVDALGAASAQAQGLNKVITTADKLRLSDHLLYLLKDEAANQGRGEAVGLLKIGRKHLYLRDAEGRVRECSPLCVLDFYVRAEYQRGGRGRHLFEHMLRDRGANAHALAVDGPSRTMEAFLRRHYAVPALVRQANNFAVAPQFFTENHFASAGVADTPSATPAAAGRYTAPKPHSSIGNVIHGGADSARGAGGAGLLNRVSAAGKSSAPAAAGRFTAPKPQSSIGNVIHGGADSVRHAEGAGLLHNSTKAAGTPSATTTAAAGCYAAPNPHFSIGDVIHGGAGSVRGAGLLNSEGACYPRAPTPEPAGPPIPRPLFVEPAPVAQAPVTAAPVAPAPVTAAPVVLASVTAAPVAPAGGDVSVRRPSQLTDEGFFDMKYYHNKMW